MATPYELSTNLEAIEKGAQVIVDGGTFTDALLAAGYSETVACHGRSQVPDTMWRAIARLQAKQGKQYGLLAKEFSQEQIAELVEGRLIANTISGSDDGCGSIKLLGGMKKHRLFESDNQTGVIVLQVPTLNPAGKEHITIDSRDLE